MEYLFFEIMYMFRILNFGHCNLFVIWDLIFAISGSSGFGLETGCPVCHIMILLTESEGAKESDA
jgi:hypothetical protein